LPMGVTWTCVSSSASGILRAERPTSSTCTAGGALMCLVGLQGVCPGYPWC
jgi:hypothetical protein